MGKDIKTILRTLKSIKTKLLSKQCETEEDFEQIQDKLNQIEIEINEIQKNLD